MSSDVILESHLNLVYAKKVAGGYSIGEPYAVNLGNYELRVNSRNGGFNDLDNIDKVTGTGTLTLYGAGLDVNSVSVKNLNILDIETLLTTGDVTVTGALVMEEETRLEAGGKVTVGGSVQMDEDAVIDAEQSFSAGSLQMLVDSELVSEYGDILVKGETSMQDDCELNAPEGKITLNDVVLDLEAGDDYVFWNASQNDEDVYQISVLGNVRTLARDDMPYDNTVEDEAPICIGSDVYPGTVLVTAPKAADGWFAPRSLAYDDGYFRVYKSGSSIIYDPHTTVSVRLFRHADEVNKYGTLLRYGDPIDPDDPDSEEFCGYDNEGIMSDFETMDEALKEIDKLAATAIPADGVELVKGAKLPFVRYDVLLHYDQDIQNAQGKPAPLSLPAKTSLLTIAPTQPENQPMEVMEVKFTGAVTLKSDLTLDPAVQLVPVKQTTVKGNIDTVPVPANYTLGTWRLTYDWYDPNNMLPDEPVTIGQCQWGRTSYATIGNVTATVGKGGLILAQSKNYDWIDPDDVRYGMRVSGTLNSDVTMAHDTQLTVQGAATIPTLTFGAAGGDDMQAPFLDAQGALTLGVVQQYGDKSRNERSGVIRKADTTKPVTFTGVKRANGTMMSVERDHEHTEAAPLTLLFGGSGTVSSGTMAITGPAGALNIDDWQRIYSGDERAYYDFYQYKNAIYVGAGHALIN